MAATSARRLRGLVDLQRGTVSRDIFVSDDLYEQELERVFVRSWLFIGHESQIPKPGDFFVSSMGEESVILARGRDTKIHVFLNTCRHRGMKVCRYDEGNTPLFTCPYHGWSYGLDGKLVGVPRFKDAYREQLDKSQWGLPEPRVANYRGLIWACWDADSPPFEEYLGDMKLYLDDFLEMPDGGEGEWEAFAGVHKWIMPSNWKFAAENFAGDNYHGPSHISVERVGISTHGGKGRHMTDVVRHPQVGVNISTPEGHSARVQLFLGDYPYVEQYSSIAVVEDYFREAWYKRQQRLGERARIRGQGGTIFPNLSYSNGRNSIAVWHPRSAMRTECWRWYLIPKAAPTEVKDLYRHYVMRYAAAAGMTEQDDLENWNYASAASRGTIARRYPYNYQIGFGFEEPPRRHPWLASETSLVTEGTSEENARGMYRRWAELMGARSWAELKPRSRKNGISSD